jgi:hypothetical protein
MLIFEKKNIFSFFRLLFPFSFSDVLSFSSSSSSSSSSFGGLLLLLLLLIVQSSLDKLVKLVRAYQPHENWVQQRHLMADVGMPLSVTPTELNIDSLIFIEQVVLCMGVSSSPLV